MSAEGDEAERLQVLEQYRKKVREHREMETRVKTMRTETRDLVSDFNKTEDDLKALQSVGQIIGDVLKQLDDDRFIVKASSGPRYVVGCRNKLDKAALKPGTRVSLDMTTLTIMRKLPREVDPTVFHMLNEDPGGISFSEIGGLSEQIRELREVIELPLTNPELFIRVGIKPPKGVLLYGPPGTGKTLLARALASNISATFLKVVASAIVDKYIGESARVVREMFGYAKDHQPCVIFMDEIDAIGGSRFSEGTSADREIQRTLMELLNQLDGFEDLGQVKMVMATNRPDILDPALLRPGRLDRKIEIPLPNETSRLDILKIHSAPITKRGEIDFESVVKLADGFNGADLRNVGTEAGLFAIRADRDYVLEQEEYHRRKGWRWTDLVEGCPKTFRLVVAPQLRDLVRDMRRRGQTLPTAAERMAMVRDVAIFCLAFHTMKRGFELSVAVASQVLQMSEGEGFIFNFLFGKTLRSSSQAVVVRRNLDCREICAVVAMVEYQQAAESLQWSLAEGSGFLFPSVVESGEKGDLALTPAQMTTNLQTHLRAAGMEGKRCTMHSFRVGRAASHSIDGTAMDVLMEYAGVTASAAVAGAKRSRETTFIEADALPLSEQFTRSHTAFLGSTDA